MNVLVAGEAKLMRRVQRSRLRWALLATAGSVANTAVVDVAAGDLKVAAGAAGSALFVTALLLLHVGSPIRVPNFRPSIEYVALALVSMAAALLILEAGPSSLASWRFTAAAIAATVPNWYTAAAATANRRVA